VSCEPRRRREGADRGLGQVYGGGEYITLYGEAVIVAGECVTELTWPLLLSYMHPAEATARWERINADGSRVVMC
jgi:hypothetical protein